MHCAGGGGESLWPGGVSSPGGVPASGPGGVYPSMQWGRTPREQDDRQVQRYYLAPNFVAGGKKYSLQAIDRLVVTEFLRKIMWSPGAWRNRTCSKSARGTGKPDSILLVEFKLYLVVQEALPASYTH